MCSSDLSIALEEEQGRRSTLQETLVDLEESNNLDMSKLRKEHDHAQALAKVLKTKNSELVVENVRLLEANEKLEKDLKSLESSLASLNKSHDQLQAQILKELPSCSPIAINDDACATNSTSCEASILRENVELRAQLDLLTSDACKIHT